MSENNSSNQSPFSAYKLSQMCKNILESSLSTESKVLHLEELKSLSSIDKLNTDTMIQSCITVAQMCTPEKAKEIKENVQNKSNSSMVH